MLLLSRQTPAKPILSLEQVAASGAQIAAFSELGITSYSTTRLCRQHGVRPKRSWLERERQSAQVWSERRKPTAMPAACSQGSTDAGVPATGAVQWSGAP
jgi:hypothetical protein